jgi:uncharacterized membrane protein YdjX (TVP38/TMEM64 family)
MLEPRRTAYLQLAILVILVAFLALSPRFFRSTDFVLTLQQRVVGLGAWSALCYPLLFAACNVLLLPGGILSVGAGFFFGLWWGFFLVLVGNVIAAAISFALSRWLGARLAQGRFATNQMLRVVKVAVERDAWKIIFLSQLHPLFPTSLLNYLYGLTRIRFSKYMFWATVGRIPGLFLYAYLGTLGQLGLNLARGKSHPHALEYWTWGGAFIVSVLLFVLLTRIALRALRDVQNASESCNQEGHVHVRAIH